MNEPEPAPAPEPEPVPDRARRYVAFWNEREPPHALGLARIGFGLALLGNALEPVVRRTLLELYANPRDGGIFGREPRAAVSLFRVLPDTPTVVWALAIAFAIAALALTLGLFTRVAAVACFVLQVTFFDRLGWFAFGADNVYRVFAFLFVLAPSGAAYSLDALLRGRGAADVPKWPRRLMIAQLTFIYVRTGIIKLGSSWSLSGGYSALYYALSLPSYARFPGRWLAVVYPVTQVGTFVSKFFEITFFLVPLGLYFARHPEKGGRVRRFLARPGVRYGYMAVGAFMHVSLLFLMKLGMFSVVMLGVYPCLLEPEEARRVVDAVRSRGRALVRLVAGRGERAPAETCATADRRSS